MVKYLPITGKNQLIYYFEQGCKPKNDWSIGTEHEQFIFQVLELTRAPYEGERGIRTLLTAFSKEGWQPELEAGPLIALKRDDAFITLEPAGQFELSGAKLKTLHEMLFELEHYNEQLYRHVKDLDLALLSHALDPKTKREDMPWMPKQRYDIMRDYMPKRGNFGLDMMTATSTVQVNLDYSSEEDLARKFRVSMALQPVATAMFANSPITRGKLTGFKSYREHIWTDTDPDRCGLLPFVFDEGFTFEKYVDYALAVPMYFVKRGDTYFNHAGQSFKDFMKGKLKGREGELPLMKDFEDHLTTLFPEVRLKQFLEMRGVDGGPLPHIMALSAFWTGLLYDQEALEQAYELTKDWTYLDCKDLLENVTRDALEANFRDRPIYETALTTLNLAAQGLKNRGYVNSKGQDESIYLDYLFELMDRRICPADLLIRDFQQKYNQDVDAFLKGYLRQG